MIYLQLKNKIIRNQVFGITLQFKTTKAKFNAIITKKFIREEKKKKIMELNS